MVSANLFSSFEWVMFFCFFGLVISFVVENWTFEKTATSPSLCTLALCQESLANYLGML